MMLGLATALMRIQPGNRDPLVSNLSSYGSPCSEPDDEAIQQFIEAAAAEPDVDPSLPSTSFAGTSKRGGPKGVMDDYKLAQADLQRRVG